MAAKKKTAEKSKAKNKTVKKLNKSELKKIKGGMRWQGGRESNNVEDRRNEPWGGT